MAFLKLISCVAPRPYSGKTFGSGKYSNSHTHGLSLFPCVEMSRSRISYRSHRWEKLFICHSSPNLLMRYVTWRNCPWIYSPRQLQVMFGITFGGRWSSKQLITTGSISKIYSLITLSVGSGKANVLWRWRCSVGFSSTTDNTRNMLKRRHYNIGDDHNCLLYGLPIEEMIDHMIFMCTFSQQCQAKLGLMWPAIACRLQRIQVMRDTYNKPLFLETFIVAAWSLWKEINNKHFRAINPSIISWLSRFKKDFELLQYRIKEGDMPFLLYLVNSLH